MRQQPSPREVPPREILKRSAESLMGWLVGPLQAAIFIGCGGVVLATAWQMGPGTLLARREIAAYTGRAEGRVVGSWLSLDFDPPSEGSVLWRNTSRLRICQEVEYRRPGGPEPQRVVFCSNRTGAPVEHALADLDELAAGVPFEWRRDEVGLQVPELRISRPALDWLARAEPQSWHELVPRPEVAAVRPAPADELEALRLSFDDPVDYLVASWSRPPLARLPVAFVPGEPERALPVGVSPPPPSGNVWVAVVGSVIIGLACWVGGISSLSQDPRIRWAVGVFGLVTLPWWGDAFPRAIARLSPGTAEIVGEAYEDLTAPPEGVIARRPAEAPGAGNEVLRWTLANSTYADTLGNVPLAKPQPAPANPDAALAALVKQVDAHARSLSDAEAAALFDRLWRDKEAQRRGAGIAFVSAARTCLLDPRRSEEARRAAFRFLDAWVTQPIEMLISGEPGYAERLRLWRSLTQVPHWQIANPAKWTVDEAEGRDSASP